MPCLTTAKLWTLYGDVSLLKIENLEMFLSMYAHLLHSLAQSTAVVTFSRPFTITDVPPFSYDSNDVPPLGKLQSSRERTISRSCGNHHLHCLHPFQNLFSVASEQDE